MKQNKLSNQQRQWIKDAYLSICESPEAFGYDSHEGHLDEVVEVIKEDVEQAFHTILSLIHI